MPFVITFASTVRTRDAQAVKPETIATGSPEWRCADFGVATGGLRGLRQTTTAGLPLETTNGRPHNR